MEKTVGVWVLVAVALASIVFSFLTEGCQKMPAADQKWAQLREGMTESDVIALLGSPTGKVMVPDPDPFYFELKYSNYGVSCYVRLDYQTRRVTGWQGPD